MHEDKRRRLVNVTEGAKYTGVSRRKLYMLIREGRIIAVKIGRKTLIDLSSVDQFHQSLPQLKREQP